MYGEYVELSGLVSLEKDLAKFHWAKRKALEEYRKLRFDRALAFTHVAATYAWKLHLGIWCDSELEDLLSLIGRQISRQKTSEKPSYLGLKGAEPKIGYIVSELSNIGGHSKACKQWINALSGVYEQYLYITNAVNFRLKIDEPQMQGCHVRVINYGGNRSILIGIEQLIRFLERDSPKVLVLFIHPNDVVAIAALNGLKKKPYILFFNHADYQFWLGKNIVDLLVEWRSESFKYSKKYRHIEKATFIPLFEDRKFIAKSKDFLKKKFGIPPSATVSITIGAPPKVKGDPHLDYFKAVEEILRINPNHFHISVATPKIKSEICSDVRDRFILLEATPHVEELYSLADFLIETFPEIGGTVRVEAIVHKLPLVAFHNKKFSLLSDTDVLPSSYPLVASSTEEVIKYANYLIKNQALRESLGSQLHDYYMKNFSKDKICILIRNAINRQINEPQTNGKLEYNPEYVYNWTKASKDTQLNKELLAFASKMPSFSFAERIKFYSAGLVSGEFKNIAQKLKYLIFAVLGSYCSYIKLAALIQKVKRFAF